ncbi:MAG: hypothetical protein M3N21_02310 [Actinomycetota bacterium]|nr:hypothetical protein [Actinomycetota bacterium]
MRRRKVLGEQVLRCPLCDLDVPCEVTESWRASRRLLLVPAREEVRRRATCGSCTYRFVLGNQDPPKAATAVAPLWLTTTEV